MTVNELIVLVGRMTDESLPSLQILDYINNAIAKINLEADANFPFITAGGIGLEYTALPEMYQRSLVADFASALVKYADSSVQEGDAFMSRFNTNMEKFRTTYIIPTDYASTNVAYTLNNYDDNPYQGGW